MAESLLSEVPFIGRGPEAMLRVNSVVGNRERTTGLMDLGPWSTGEDGATSAGAFGVFVDDMFGYPLVAAGPTDHWGVSTSIYVEFCAPLPGAPEQLHGEGTTVFVDRSTAVAHGSIRDARGALLAVGSQRTRYIPRPTTFSSEPRPPESEWLARVGILGVTGADLSIEGSAVTGSLVVSEAVRNPLGNLHGGISFAFAEVLAQRALRSGGIPFVTSSIHLSYVRPFVGGSTVTAEATLRYSGRTLAVVDVTLRDESGKPGVLATVTGSNL